MTTIPFNRECVVRTATGSDSWRDKYFESLKRLEAEQEGFRSAEATLKRLIGRLCTAALGQSTQLDEQLKRLQAAMRREVSVPELDRITPALTQAIQALDEPAGSEAAATLELGTPRPTSSANPTTPPATTGEDGTSVLLLALLAELRRDPALGSRADALETKISAVGSERELTRTLTSITELVSERIGRLERAKQEVEGLLTHMVGKLDEIGRFVAEQHQTQNESHASSETLNVQLAGEIKAMGESVETSGDVQQIRAQVRGRIELIDQHLLAFREREAKLSASMLASNEKMRARITELEAKAHQLNDQLRDEQRLASIDLLTNLPNRLAYEQRFGEELERWKRFQQPTCIAVWDIDYFKRINDTYGHRAGDRVLRAVADRFAARIRRTDFIARYGGEEFVMLLPGTRVEDAMGLLEDLRTSICSIGFHYRGEPIAITVSGGVTALSGGDTTEQAFERADKALYQAKQSGRNRCVAA